MTEDRCAECGMAWPCTPKLVLDRAEELLGQGITWVDAQAQARVEVLTEAMSS